METNIQKMQVLLETVRAGSFTRAAERLSAVIAAYGPESLAVSEMPLNHGFGGITRRLMNHLGSPNYISGLALCMGNTAQVHRAVYGWFTSPDWTKTDCIMYFGSGPASTSACVPRSNAERHSW